MAVGGKGMMRSSYIVEAGVHNNICQSLFGAGKGKRENGQYTPKGLAPVTCLYLPGLTSQSLQPTNPHKQLKYSNHGPIRGASISGKSNWYLKKYTFLEETISLKLIRDTQGHGKARR